MPWSFVSTKGASNMGLIAEPMHRAFWREEQEDHGPTVWRLYRSDIGRSRGEVRMMPRGYVPFDSGTAHRAPSPVEDEWDSLDGAMWFLETTLLPMTFRASAKESRRVLLESMRNPPADIPLPAWVLEEGGKGWPEVRLVNTGYDAKVVRNGMRAWFWSVSHPSCPLRCGIAGSRTEAMAEVEQTLQLSAFLRRWA